MSTRPIALDPQDYADALSVIGLKITVLSSREQTDSHEVTLQEGVEGAGPPPHAHGWCESFYVLRGILEATVDGQPVHGTAGTFIHVPANTVHAFHFGPGGGAMLEIAGAGGSATRLFQRLDQEMDHEQPDFVKAAQILEDCGARLVG